MQIGKSYFYPRPPRGGRPPSAKIKNNCAYFYPRPPRGGRPGDGSEVTLTLRFLSTPSARRATPPKLADMLRVYLFLSTPSARRATSYSSYGNTGCKISIHALREEGDNAQDEEVFGYQISIHALREEGDTLSSDWIKEGMEFLSTPSARRATFIVVRSE